MSNANLNPALVNAFEERVNTITKQRLTWQSTAFKSANDALYAMLGEVYDLYMEAKGDSAENEQLREWLIDQCNAKQLPLSKKPTMLQMLVKLIFTDNDTDTRRVSSYARVLNTAALSDEVSVGADVAKFIQKYGGVEAIRAAQSKGTKTPSQRAELGRSIALQQPSLAEVSIGDAAENVAAAQNQFVLLVGQLNAQGSVEIRHVCYEVAPSPQHLSAKTAVNAALSNLYTLTQRQLRETEAQCKEEQAVETRNARAQALLQPTVDASLAQAA